MEVYPSDQLGRPGLQHGAATLFSCMDSAFKCRWQWLCPLCALHWTFSKLFPALPHPWVDLEEIWLVNAWPWRALWMSEGFTSIAPDTGLVLYSTWNSGMQETSIVLPNIFSLPLFFWHPFSLPLPLTLSLSHTHACTHARTQTHALWHTPWTKASGYFSVYWETCWIFNVTEFSQLTWYAWLPKIT